MDWDENTMDAEVTVTDRRDDVRESLRGWGASGGFFELIIAGFLVGFGLDWWLGTDPWLVVSGIVLGSYAGFMRLWNYAKREIRPRER